MGTVTYKNQPGIEKTKGAIPLAGTSHIYKVTKKLWPKQVEEFLEKQLSGFTLHICCGKSELGDVRLDMFEPDVDIVGDAARLPFADRSFDTLLIDPPYNGKFQWNHDMLSELSRVSNYKIIFQHWFIPANIHGYYRKDHKFKLVEPLTLWSPRSYFGRVQVISIFERNDMNLFKKDYEEKFIRGSVYPYMSKIGEFNED